MPNPVQGVPNHTNNPYAGYPVPAGNVNPYNVQQSPQNISGVYQYPTNAPMQPQYLTKEQRERMKLMEINRIVPPKRGHSWSGLAFRPEKVNFQNQDANEYVFALVRSHWTVNFGWIVKNFFYLFLPIILAVVYAALDPNLGFITLKTTALFVIGYYSVILTNIIRNFFDWYFDPYIVTNQRIVHYEFKPFSSYTIKETELRNIESIKEKSAGPIAGFLNYGTIIVTTASEKSDFEFIKVPNATLVRDIISDLKRIDEKYA